MAVNPIIYNDGGNYRFRDFISQIPEFLKSENDVVILLQLFSDYINNAYRNITTIKKFEFKLISIESRVGLSNIKLNKLASLFKEAEFRNNSILYLSKPISTPVTSNEYFLGIFEYTGTLETLSPSVITFPLTEANDGNRVYIEFTKYPKHSGSYVYNRSQGTLTPDPFNASQDPFSNTPNKPIPTIGGIAPRIIQFEPTDISAVNTRKIKQVGDIIYFEVFFTATLNNIKDVPSIEIVKPTDDDPYLIDYYNSIDTIPSEYKYKYVIDFPSICANFNWSDIYNQGNGLFYARDLTQYVPEVLKNRDGNNIYVDPIHHENYTDIPIYSITVDGATDTLTVKTTLPHTLNVGSRFNIQGDGVDTSYDKSVTKVISSVEFQYFDDAPPALIETAINVNIPNLSYYKIVNKKSNNGFYLKVPYRDLEGTVEFAPGDVIVRIKDREELKYNTFNSEDVDEEKDYIIVNTDPTLFNFLEGDKITLRGSATYPAGFSKTITTLTYSTSTKLATAICPENHELRTGFRVYISGANQSQYNGMVTITKVDDTTFTYTPISIPTVFIATGTTITLDYELTEGEVYTIVDIEYDANTAPNTYRIKLKDAIITDTGTGKIDIVKLNVYFDGIDDVDITTNKITLHGGENPLNGLQVGDAVRLRKSDNLSLPEPLTEELTYNILEIDSDDNTVILSINGLTPVELLIRNPGAIDFIKLNKTQDIGVIKSVDIASAGSNGQIILKEYSGDLVSKGMIAKITDEIIDFRAVIAEVNSDGKYIDSTAVTWDDGVGDVYAPQYKKGDFVVYNGIRYKLRNSIVVSKPKDDSMDTKTHNPSPPDKLSDFYENKMDDIIIPKSNLTKNPYMFGMYITKSLAYDEEPNFNAGYDDLSLYLYVKQVEQLELKYGHDQRQWHFSPRVAPSDVIERNGFIEIVKGTNLSNDIVNIDASPYVKANVEHPLLLEGTELNITTTITTLTYSDTTGLATAICSGEHRLKTGVRVTISGAVETDYNGTFEVDVVNSTTFTYEPTVAPTVTPATGTISAEFNNTIVFEIESLAVENLTSVRATTKSVHGLKSGSTIKISGATDSGYDTLSSEIVSVSVDGAQFVYTVADTTGLDPESPTNAIATYQPLAGDYINAISQLSINKRGIYSVSDGEWLKFDDTQVTQHTTIFTQQNLFDVTEDNPSIAKGTEFNASLSVSGNKVTVTLNKTHDYTVGTVVNITNVEQTVYNGAFTVTEGVPGTNTFKYKIGTYAASIADPPTAATNKKIKCQSNKWYKFIINQIQWQKLSNALVYTASTNNREYFFKPNKSADEYRNNVSTLSNEFTFEYVQSLIAVNSTSNTITVTNASNFKIGDKLTYTANGDTITGLTDGEYTVDTVDYEANLITLEDVDITAGAPFNSYFTQEINIAAGDIVNVHDQLLSHEIGKYRVEKTAWRRLNTKLCMKVRDITVDAQVIDDDAFSENPYKYVIYNEEEVDAYIQENFKGEHQVYKAYNTTIPNFQFLLEKIENMDTTAPVHKIYNAKFDKNTVASRKNMKRDFLGVDDMTYPLIEKIERLVYLKDPNVIDFEFIDHLARYMGYDMSPLIDDMAESIFYKTEETKQKSIRSIIKNLPYFNALRATKPGLESLLLTFGLVGKVVNLWTESSKPYQNFIPDFMLRGIQYSRMYDKNPTTFVATPHFKVDIDIEGNFDNQVTVREITKLINNIEIYKPINTVFDGIILYVEYTLKAAMYAGEMKAIGRMQADVGYESIEFDYGALIDSDCI